MEPPGYNTEELSFSCNPQFARPLTSGLRRPTRRSTWDQGSPRIFLGATSPRGLVSVHRRAVSSPTLPPVGHSIDPSGSVGLAFGSLLPQASVLVAAPWGIHSPAELALVLLLATSPRRDPLVHSSVESFNSCSTLRHHTGDQPVTRLTTFRLSVGSAVDRGPCGTPTSGEEATNSSLSSAAKPVLAHPRRQS